MTVHVIQCATINAAHVLANVLVDLFYLFRFSSLCPMLCCICLMQHFEAQVKILVWWVVLFRAVSFAKNHFQPAAGIDVHITHTKPTTHVHPFF